MQSDERPFQKEHLDSEDREKPDTFTVRLNKQEREVFNQAKKIIEQTKDSTAIKQLAWVGIANVLHDKKTRLILEILFKNKRNNARLGIAEF